MIGEMKGLVGMAYNKKKEQIEMSGGGCGRLLSCSGIIEADEDASSIRGKLYV